MRRVDLNADIGEGEAAGGVDAALLDAVTSVNIACGLHAGSPLVMQETLALARSAGVAIGAHPSFLDREGFGRREQQAPPAEVEALVLYQVGALAALARAAGLALCHVKPHGALYNMAAGDGALAAAIVRAVRSFDPRLAVVGLAGSALMTAATDAGLTALAEGFADRAYRPDGTLAPRTVAGAVVSDPDVVSARAVRLATRGEVEAVDGSRLTLQVDTICVHGDTPGAAGLARAVRVALERAGVRVCAPDRR